MSKELKAALTGFFGEASVYAPKGMYAGALAAGRHRSLEFAPVNDSE